MARNPIIESTTLWGIMKPTSGWKKDRLISELGLSNRFTRMTRFLSNGKSQKTIMPTVCFRETFSLAGPAAKFNGCRVIVWTEHIDKQISGLEL